MFIHEITAILYGDRNRPNAGNELKLEKICLFVHKSIFYFVWILITDHIRNKLK